MCSRSQSGTDSYGASVASQATGLGLRVLACENLHRIPSDVIVPTISLCDVIDKCASGLAVLGLRGELCEVNPAFCELTGHTRKALLGPGFDPEQLLFGEDVASYRRHITALAGGGEQSYREPLRFLRPDGVTTWIDLSVNLLRGPDGAPIGLVMTAVDITEQRRAEESFRDMSLRDTLTKLPNRRLLRDRLRGAIARAQRDQRKVALLFVDLDHFKPINDSMGHEIGDRLLKAAADRLVACLRTYDTAARLGGDEFVILLPDLAQYENARRVAERIRTRLAEPFVMEDGHRLQISASIGVSFYPEHADTAHDLLQAGDEAMYAAKNAGRNRVAYSDRTPTPVAIPTPVRDPQSGIIHLTWEASLVSGNAFIDNEHRELFRQANQLLDLATSSEAHPVAIRNCLLHLVRSIQAHFEHEERILSQVGYPALDAHAASHRELAARANALSQQTADQATALSEILDFIVAKVVFGHLATEDREYFSSLGSDPTR